ncbi:MAG: HAD family hydrolase [Chloroflexi bacterium]|nr:HAD family hydrolase [Chloroflexota bacterium]
MGDIRGIIFDLGGTLMYLDSTWDVITSSNAASLEAYLRSLGYSINERFIEAFLRRKRDYFDRARAEGVEYLTSRALDETLAEFDITLDEFTKRRAVEAWFEPEKAAWKPFPESLPTLRALHSMGYRLGLISNATDDVFIEELVDRFGFRPYLAPVLNSAAVGIRKPRREIFEMVLKPWGMSSHQVVMVGDDLEMDVQGAKNVGMRSILVTWCEAPRNEQFRSVIVPDIAIGSLAELPELIVQL